MLKPLVTKYAYDYLAESKTKRTRDFFTCLVLSAAPACVVRLAGGGVLLSVLVLLVCYGLVLVGAAAIRSRMRELVFMNPDLGRTWVAPDDASTLD